MKMDAPFVIALCGLLAALIGAALVMVGTNIHVRDSIDHFMTDLPDKGCGCFGVPASRSLRVC
jgi:hypothetical protein